MPVPSVSSSSPTSHILETICDVGELDDTDGTGIAFQIDVEDAVGVAHQVNELVDRVEDIL